MIDECMWGVLLVEQQQFYNIFAIIQFLIAFLQENLTKEKAKQKISNLLRIFYLKVDWWQKWAEIVVFLIPKVMHW